MPLTGCDARVPANQDTRDLRAGWLTLSLILSVCAGCVPLIVGAAAGTAGAVYVLGKLQDERQEPLSAVHRAAVQGLKDLDLPILTDKSDKLTARVESEFADGSHVWIDLDTVPESRTRITIRVGVMGDEVRSRQLLKAITKHLPDS